MLISVAPIDVTSLFGQRPDSHETNPDDVAPHDRRVGRTARRQTERPPPSPDAVILTTGKAAARYGALGRILATPPDARTRDVWKALRDELDRVVACLDVQKPPRAEARKLHCEIGIGSHEEDNYLLDLISAVSQSTDPAAIPTLIRVARGHAGAFSALVNFGDVAVPALIESALSSRSGPWVTENSGSMGVLAEMLAGEHITAVSRERITDTARTLLHNKFTWVTKIPVAQLALATGDPVLRDEITRMVNDSSELMRRGIPAERIRWVPNILGYSLAEPRKP